MHIHPLYFTRKTTSWNCDGTRIRSGGCAKGNKTVGTPRFRCEECDFDLCELCLDMRSPTLGTLIKYDSHVHPLQCTAREDSSAMNCSECMYSYQTEKYRKVNRYRCDMCNYNICEKCLLKENYQDISSGQITSSNQQHSHSSPKFTSNIVNPQDDMKKDYKKYDQDDLPEDKVCVICLENPKDATLVHAQSGIGHNVVCFGCANQLKNKGDVCPICRGPIDIVVKHYN
jgi:E3 ubiquitin-protein ligase Mdm2